MSYAASASNFGAVQNLACHRSQENMVGIFDVPDSPRRTDHTPKNTIDPYCGIVRRDFGIHVCTTVLIFCQETRSQRLHSTPGTAARTAFHHTSALTIVSRSSGSRMGPNAIPPTRQLTDFSQPRAAVGSAVLP